MLRSHNALPLASLLEMLCICPLLSTDSYPLARIITRKNEDHKDEDARLAEHTQTITKPSELSILQSIPF
jgi:hypothetical protein